MLIKYAARRVPTLPSVWGTSVSFCPIRRGNSYIVHLHHNHVEHEMKDDLTRRLLLSYQLEMSFVQLYVIGREETLLPSVLTRPPIIVWKLLQSVSTKKRSKDETVITYYSCDLRTLRKA